MYDKQTHTLTERMRVRLRSQGKNCVNSSTRKEQKPMSFMKLFTWLRHGRETYGTMFILNMRLKRLGYKQISATIPFGKWPATKIAEIFQDCLDDEFNWFRKTQQTMASMHFCINWSFTLRKHSLNWLQQQQHHWSYINIWNKQSLNEYTLNIHSKQMFTH